jgi:hypothetical protein
MTIPNWVILLDKITPYGVILLSLGAIVSLLLRYRETKSWMYIGGILPRIFVCLVYLGIIGVDGLVDDVPIIFRIMGRMGFIFVFGVEVIQALVFSLAKKFKKK